MPCNGRERKNGLRIVVEGRSKKCSPYWKAFYEDQHLTDDEMVPETPPTALLHPQILPCNASAHGIQKQPEHGTTCQNTETGDTSKSIALYVLEQGNLSRHTESTILVLEPQSVNNPLKQVPDLAISAIHPNMSKDSYTTTHVPTEIQNIKHQVKETSSHRKLTHTKLSTKARRLNITLLMIHIALSKG